jgi:hypothetical protein
MQSPAYDEALYRLGTSVLGLLAGFAVALLLFLPLALTTLVSAPLSHWRSQVPLRESFVERLLRDWPSPRSRAPSTVTQVSWRLSWVRSCRLPSELLSGCVHRPGLERCISQSSGCLTRSSRGSRGGEQPSAF